MKLQVDIPKDLNKKLKIEKVNSGCKNLPDTVVMLLRKVLK